MTKAEILNEYHHASEDDSGHRAWKTSLCGGSAIDVYQAIGWYFCDLVIRSGQSFVCHGDTPEEAIDDLLWTLEFHGV
jgi:hypothetical protein